MLFEFIDLGLRLIAHIINWLFNLEVNEFPRITAGEIMIASCVIFFSIWFLIFGIDRKGGK